MINKLHSRRDLLRNTGCGFASLALAGLCHDASLAGVSQLAPKPPHHRARASRVIFLFMHGGPSHLDTFDYKPRLQKDAGKDLPFKPGPNLDAKTLRLLPSPWKFKQHGENGSWVSELFPHVANHVDDLCLIHSLHTNGVSHGQAVSMLHTGTDNLVRPSMGAWVSYGLGTENNDLPGFVTIAPPRGHGGPRNYGAAFLPAAYQASAVGHSEMNIADAGFAHLDAGGVGAARQRRQLDLLQAINGDHVKRVGGDEQLDGVIESFELAFRMQAAAPQIMDLSGETAQSLALYGIDGSATDNFGRECLLARRFAEAGVRFVQVSFKQNGWDQHSGLFTGHTNNSKAVDKPIAGLLADLKRRGMLDDTLVLWGGEFGRTPIVQGADGRDHNPQGFTMWLAGGGVKGGFHYGATDDYGYFAVQNKVHMHDLHATLLNILGLDHTRLTYQYAGRDFRLTDVYGEVVTDILA